MVGKHVKTNKNNELKVNAIRSGHLPKAPRLRLDVSEEELRKAIIEGKLPTVLHQIAATLYTDLKTKFSKNGVPARTLNRLARRTLGIDNEKNQ